MTDTTKLIAELEELMAKPINRLTYHNYLAIRNAMPELIAEIKELSEVRDELAEKYEQATKERNAAIARAERIGRQVRNDETTLRHMYEEKLRELAETSGVLCPDMRGPCPEHKICWKCIADLRKEAIARAEKAEAALNLVATHQGEHQDTELDLYTRLELAEEHAGQMQADRHWLAGQVVDVLGKTSQGKYLMPPGEDGHPLTKDKETAITAWINAAQEAAKRFATPSCATCAHDDTNSPDACDVCIYAPDAVGNNNVSLENNWEAAKRGEEV